MTPNVIVAELTPWDPVAGAAVTLRATSVDHPAATLLNNLRWWPAIATPPRRTLELFGGDFGGAVSAGAGDLELGLAPFPNAARYAWGERPVKLWRGRLGDAFGSYSLIFSGLTRPGRVSADRRLSLGLTVDDRWADKPLLATYLGTGNAEGPAALTGTPKPLALGSPQFAEGIVIDAVNNVVQLSGYGAVNGVTVLLDRLARFGASSGNYASYAALVAATVAPGSWATCHALGLVRTGAPPAGVLTAMLGGDAAGSGGWVRTPGAVIKRIAEIAGATSGQIDSASLAALDTAAPYPISLYLRDQVTARELIQRIAASCNAAAGVSWLGQLFVVRAVIGTPVYELRSDGTRLPPVASIEQQPVSAPFWRLSLEAEPTARVHSGGEYGVVDADTLGGVAATSIAASIGSAATTATAAGISGAVDFATQVGGATKPANNADVTATAVASNSLVLGTGTTATVAAIVAATTGAATAPQSVALGIGTSTAITFTLANGAIKYVDAQINYLISSGGVTISCPLEYQIGSGSWTSFGTSSPGTDTGVGVNVFASGNGSITNSSGHDQIYSVRATGTKIGSGTGSVTSATSFLRA